MRTDGRTDRHEVLNSYLDDMVPKSGATYLQSQIEIDSQMFFSDRREVPELQNKLVFSKELCQ